MMACYYKKCVKTILLIGAMHFGCSFTYAQSNTEESNPDDLLNLRMGLLVDSYGNPVEGVRVIVRGEDRMAESNEEGYFEIDAAGNSVLVFSHPYFNTYQLRADDTRRLLTVTGGDDPEVDVAGEIEGYLALQLRDDYLPIRLSSSYLANPEDIGRHAGTTFETRVGSVSSIYTGHLNSTLAHSYAYALPGRLPGLYTEQFRGFRQVNISSAGPTLSRVSEPNDNTEMELSLRGQNPVVIVDGVQRSIFSVDPADIESISVRRDALSTIMLGQRSSRGILYVTTREPRTDRLRLSFSAQTGLQRPLDMPNPLPAYEHAYLMNEALQNDGSNRAYSAEDFQAFRNGTNPYSHPTVNWYDTLLRDNSLMSSYSLNVSDGGDVIRYMVNLSYFNLEGIFKTADFDSYNTNVGLDRYVINSKINVDILENLNVGLQLFGLVQDGNQPGAQTGSTLNALYETPNSAYPVLNPDGSFGGRNQSVFTHNLLARSTNSGYIEDETRNVMFSLDLDYKLDDLLEGLSVRAVSNFSTQASIALYRNKQRPVYGISVGDDGSVSYAEYGSFLDQSNNYVSTGNSRFWFMQSALEYDNQFGRHRLGGTLMADRREVTLNFNLPGVTVNYTGGGSYSYDNRYFVEGAVNYSGFNGYEPGNQYGLFYAFGLGWDIAGESFIRDNLSWLNQLKIRGVYGSTGNGVDNSGYYIWRDETYSLSFLAYPHGSERFEGVNDRWESNGLPNPNIRFERADKISAGIDISMFNDRVAFTGDYYRDEYYDLLQQRGSQIALMGLDYPAENIGRNLYQGVDLSLTYRNNAGNFNYFFSGNWSLMETEVLYMDEQFREYEWNERTGRPVGTVFGLIADGFYRSMEEVEQSAAIQGLDPQPGDVKYLDLNNDGVIDQFDVAPIARDKPLSYFGLTTGFSYKGLDVSVLLQGVYNRDIYLPRPSFVGSGRQGYDYIRNRWTPETSETATYPRLSNEGDTYNLNPDGLLTSFWVRSGNYIRVKNVSLSYTLPFGLTNRFNISHVQIFVNALNLFTVSGYDGVDPEVTNFMNYPLQQVISTGINIKL